MRARAEAMLREFSVSCTPSAPEASAMLTLSLTKSSALPFVTSRRLLRERELHGVRQVLLAHLHEVHAVVDGLRDGVSEGVRPSREVPVRNERHDGAREGGEGSVVQR